MQYFQKFIAKDAGFPYSLGEQVSASDPVFELHEARAKADESPALVFVLDVTRMLGFSMSSTARSSIAQSAIQRLKTLRHPDILRFLAESESPDGTVQVATEYAIPLDVHIQRNGPLKPQEAQWGLVCIARALGFMHSSKLIHGGLSLSSIYVAPGGDWKLGGFHFTTQLANAQNLQQSVNFLPQQCISPELSSGNIGAILNSHASATDSWAYGSLMHEVFGGAGRELTDTTRLPRRLVPAYQKLLSSKPSSRVPVGDFPQHPYFKSSEFVDINLFMETAPLKGEFERETFFRKLISLIPNLPRGFCINKLLPLLTQTIETKEGAAIVAAGSTSSTVSAIKSLAGVSTGPSVPATRQPPGATVSGTASAATASAAFEAIEAFRSLPGDDFNKEVASKYAVRMYGDPGVDRSVRVVMYNNIAGYLDGMDDNGLNGPVFAALCGSFGDAASPAVRDAAVKAVLVLVPRLSSRNLNTTLMAHFARLQVDPEPAIRTNTTVCLGKIATQLSEGVQRKVLVPAFLRALKDPFPPAKTAGLAALVDTGAHFSVEDLARKILPATTPLMIDPAESVRAHAFKVFDRFRVNLENFHKEESERAKYAPKGEVNGHAAGLNGVSAKSSTLSASSSWGLSSLGGLASALLNKENESGNTSEKTKVEVTIKENGSQIVKKEIKSETLINEKKSDSVSNEDPWGAMEKEDPWGGMDQQDPWGAMNQEDSLASKKKDDPWDTIIKEVEADTTEKRLPMPRTTTRRKKATKDDDDWGALLGGSSSTTSRRKGLGARRR